jgi:hypothetical protein
LEESDFLDKICWATLYTNKHVNFAAVLDSEGKLIVAKSRMSRIQKSLKVRSKINPEVYYCRYQPSYRFYTDYLLPAINKMRGTHYHYYDDTTMTNNNERIHFEVVEVNRDTDGVEIVITPLTQSKNKYLCVYFESGVSTASHEDIIMKMNNII